MDGIYDDLEFLPNQIEVPDIITIYMLSPLYKPRVPH